MDPSVMEEFRKLEQEKQKLEAEIQGIHDYLTEDGMPGLKGSLVDEEGFPRADLDIYAIRKARNRYACAQTDHVEVMKKIEQALASIHSSSKVDVPRASPAGGYSGDVVMDDSTNSGSIIQAHLAAPFALIDEVSDGSPAQAAGLRVGDEICRFGPVNLQDTGDMNSCFKAIAQLVPQSAGNAIQVQVLRGSPPVRTALELIPRQWAGRGLLGCHMAPKT
eukprot:TRINITY_DN92135_c0_g1_i1.p1 TRINITY_DN92135_c0_g1~~TRINITY_DN92135_c0_g1_i1.p1  ORF type:complete len:220 (-),score=52.91 TRINITY_DN92135_c0_g1_i1:26-685(-)